jgi:adenylate kinase family enzyme
MKNLYIIGVPRAGKSTLSKLIKEKYPIYNQFSFEAIRNGFIESQPELNMGNRNSDARKNILPKHFVTFAHWNKEILSCPSLIEGDFCSIEELSNLIDDNDEIICLGFGCRSIEEVIKGIRENDSDADYTKDWSDEQMIKHFHDTLEKDKINYDFCNKNGIKYYDTYQNRTQIFEKIIEDIKKY